MRAVIVCKLQRERARFSALARAAASSILASRLRASRSLPTAVLCILQRLSLLLLYYIKLGFRAR